MSHRFATHARAALIWGLSAFALSGAIDPLLSHAGMCPLVGAAFAKDGGGSDGGHGGEGGHGGDDGGGGGDDGGGDDGGHHGEDGGNRGRGDDDREVEHFLNAFGKDNSVIWARESGTGMTVRYGDGWTETVAGARYRLTDARGNIVTDRPARSADIKRLRALGKRR